MAGISSAEVAWIWTALHTPFSSSTAIFVAMPDGRVWDTTCEDLCISLEEAQGLPAPERPAAVGSNARQCGGG